jgi:hypothetical protein
MSYIIVHMYDFDDIQSMDILPDEDGEAAKRFKNKIEAARFLGNLGIDGESWEDSDIYIVRLH